ncbi:MAG: preprotein translocase subunit SecE [Polyangiaceae bacterium]
MATDDKSKKRKATGDAPKKKKRAPEADAAPDVDTRAAGAAADDDAGSASQRARDDDDEAPTSASELTGELTAGPDADDVPEGALVVRGGESISLSDNGEPLAAGAEHAAARVGDDELSDDAPATQLGVERYVMAAFFAAGLVGAYVVGKTIHGVWAYLSNRAFFTNAVPTLAAVSDEGKTTIGTVLGGVIALVVVLRAYRRPDVRGWADDVASELTKVKWPTKKDVINSTLVVIAASTVATVYLALLDRLWAFVTNLVYGTGS